jgi:hypothetical protein
LNNTDNASPAKERASIGGESSALNATSLLSLEDLKEIGNLQIV